MGWRLQRVGEPTVDDLDPGWRIREWGSAVRSRSSGHDSMSGAPSSADGGLMHARGYAQSRMKNEPDGNIPAADETPDEQRRREHDEAEAQRHREHEEAEQRRRSEREAADRRRSEEHDADRGRLQQREETDQRRLRDGEEAEERRRRERGDAEQTE